MLWINKIITQLPLKTLWKESKYISFTREKYLDRKSIEALLAKTSVEFAVADVGSKLNWVAIDKCYYFWKLEVREHFADNPDKIYLEHFPDNYAYIGSKWTSENGLQIILLEKIH